LLIYDKDTLTKKEVVRRQKKRIVCGAWSAQECIAFAAEDRQITICSCDGVTLGQVKVKTRPHSVSFGNQGSIVSVNLDGRTILLYNLAETDNALELAFQVHPPLYRPYLAIKTRALTTCMFRCTAQMSTTKETLRANFKLRMVGHCNLAEEIEST
jgi:hypothetical protein